MTIVLCIVAFVLGALLSGKIASAWGGVKTDVALLKMRAAIDISGLHQRLDDEIAAIKAKLP